MRSLFFLILPGCLLFQEPAPYPEPADADEDGVEAPEDCDDHDDDVHPGAQEICDGEDNDCNGAIDDDCLAMT